MSDLKQYSVNSCGFKLFFNGPSTVEDYDAKGGAGAALEDAVNNELYRGTLPTFWDLAVPEIEKLTGVKQEVDEKKTAVAKDRAKSEAAKSNAKVYETFKTYMGRVMAGADDDQKKAIVEKLNEVAAKVEVDPSPSARAARGPGKDNLDKADSILAQSNEVIESKVAKISALVPDVLIDRDEETGKPTRESLAFAIKAFVAASL